MYYTSDPPLCYTQEVLNLLIILTAKYLYLLSIVIAVVFFWKASNIIRKQLLILAAIIFPLSLIIAKLLGHFIKDPRPFVVEHVTPLIPHAADNGFPSDHTLLAMAIASVIFVYNRKWGGVLFVIALGVGISRVLAKVHHPLDIIGSTVIAILVTAGVVFTKQLLTRKTS